jgi:hemerythrin
MALFDWSETLSVRVEAIDSQHKRLIGLINELHDAMTKGEGRKALGPVLEGLLEYMRTHFRTEEKPMLARGYPSYADHKRKHDDLTATVVKLRNDFLGGETVITMEVMKLLKDWLTEHIKSTDKLLGAFLNQAPA